MINWATPAIVLGLTGNLQGTWKNFNLETVQKIKRCHFTPYLMLASMIKKVEHFGCGSRPAGTFNFADRSGIPFNGLTNLWKVLSRMNLYHILRWLPKFQEWCWVGTSPSRQWRSRSCLKEKPRTRLPIMLILNLLTLQEWTSWQLFIPTMIKLPWSPTILIMMMVS